MSVAAVILAGGRSSRMGRNKLLHPLDAAGSTLLARAADAALASRARPVVVVLGHEAAAARAVLGGRPVDAVENPDHAAGLSTSLQRGLAALPPDVAAAIVLLADMPGPDAALVDRLVAASGDGASIAAPRRDGRFGHPVLWPRRFFPELAAVTGDRGGRDLLARHADAVVAVPVTGDGAFLDLDTPVALRAWLARKEVDPGGGEGQGPSS